ncbi:MULTISPECIES: DUF1601 domain-containing protein [unclassified Endozoicomonas]|uniref:DUF1601 domain-containing protein n=2 Tax=Endozoicomonas TaxID=305899 RepID=UPI003BB4DF22
MEKGGAGISWACTTSGNDYNQSDDHTGASGSGRYRYGTVRRMNTPLPYIPERHAFYRASDASSANHPPRHSIKPVQDFNALITQAKMDDLMRISTHYGDRYKGKKHSHFACSIKQYTSRSKRPLNHSEQRQLIPLLHAFKATSGWTWRSLTTTLHAFTSAGVFTPHKYMNERSKEAQTAFLSTLLDAVILKCNQEPDALGIDTRGTANLLWALAKMVGNGLELETTPKLKEAVVALLPLVKTKAESTEDKDHFKPQEVANLQWALAKLVDNGLALEKTAKLKEAVAALLPHVKTRKSKGYFKPQEVANLLWALAKLVDNGLAQTTPNLKEAMAALLPLMKTKAESKEEKEHFNPQHIANLVWAVAKLVDNGLELEKVAKFKEAVGALLPLMQTKAKSKEKKDQFKPQEVANIMWALAKLGDNGLEKTAKLKEIMTVLLYNVKNKVESTEEKDHFKPQEVTNLLWVLAKLGEAIELNLVKSTFDSLVERVSESSQFYHQGVLMSLWGVMVFCARFYLCNYTNNKSLLEKHIGELFSRLENTLQIDTEDESIIAMAASWLGRACPVVPHYPTITSQSQSSLRDQLQSSLPSLKIEEEKSLNSLPPVDLLLPDYNLVIDVQGPSHYVCGDFKTRNGSTLLKVALLKKLGFEVIEIPVNKLNNQDSMKRVIEHIKIKLAVSPEVHALVLHSSGEEAADEAYFTADEEWQFSDDCYFTAEEYLEEQTEKPKKRKRKRKKASKN